MGRVVATGPPWPSSRSSRSSLHEHELDGLAVAPREERAHPDDEHQTENPPVARFHRAHLIPNEGV